MTLRSDLTAMQMLVDVKYRQQQDSFSRLIVQENKLRGSLRKLDEHLAASRKSDDTDQKSIGADVIWQSWIGRKKRELNLQLAQILAVKERHIAQVRTAYGKVLVTDKLSKMASTKEKRKLAQSELNRAITPTLFK